MGNSWLFFANLDLDGGSLIYPAETHLFHVCHMWSQIGSFVDSSLYNSRCFHISGSIGLQEALSCISKFSGAVLFWFSRGQNSSNPRGPKPRNCQSRVNAKHTASCRGSLAGSLFSSRSSAGCTAAVFSCKIASATIKHLWNEVEHFQLFPMLSIAAAILPPIDNLKFSKALAIPLENTDDQNNGQTAQARHEEEHQGCASLSLSNIYWTNTRDAVEPSTGIKFPTILDNFLTGDGNIGLPSEIKVLVGIGSRSMKIIKVRNLNIYAFGLYVHPDSVCKKLGPKYASMPINELKNREDFFEDLLREDIHMTVRLVVNCRGLKINTVRDAFERSLRARLLKMNPNTDYDCLRAYGSYFTQDIPLPVGTTINITKTADGELITEIGGKQIGAVRSKDLCRAFFDMYIGNIPVSAQTKQEIGRNVAGIIKRC